jgi:hypothetical protein
MISVRVFDPVTSPVDQKAICWERRINQERTDEDQAGNARDMATDVRPGVKL